MAKQGTHETARVRSDVREKILETATTHPARKVANAHTLELRQRLLRLAERLDVDAPQELAGDLAVLINGAFVSTSLFEPGKAVPLLHRPRML